ncbi:PKD domain-containing protein, partial [bacterium]|nr:PKD domain-containing protein [bacterium]
RLPDSYENTGTATTQLWTVPAGKYAWGYAENNSGTDYDSDKGSNKLDISNAVDEHGNPVSLPNIRFLKIQTAVLQQAGWLNEVSSELRGAKELK